MKRKHHLVARAAAVAGLVAACLAGDGRSAAVAGSSLVPQSARRPAEQTLLTYPEWFLVHSPAEYAALVAEQPSHRFPFIGHIGQLWQGYAAVTREQWRERAPPNIGYHTMIVVIATSTTIEYALRAAYEETIGRIGWSLGGSVRTDEDRYAAQVAEQYVAFIRREPWYLFDFRKALVGLWRDVPVWGAGLPRKWERRYALTTEYGIKALYAALIEKATRTAYEPALLVTDVVVDRLPDTLPPGVRLLQTLPGDRALLELPRYFDFRIAATALAARGSSIVDVAGNEGRILVTAWARDPVQWPAGAEVLFEQPLLTRPGMRRVAVLVPVAQLSRLLRDATALKLVIEHVYDY